MPITPALEIRKENSKFKASLISCKTLSQKKKSRDYSAHYHLIDKVNRFQTNP
jgi:hypothetical protein